MLGVVAVLAEIAAAVVMTGAAVAAVAGPK